jgi:hypothetical protein
MVHGYFSRRIWSGLQEVFLLDDQALAWANGPVISDMTRSTITVPWNL